MSAGDLATREGEVVFGQAWLKSMRGRLGERMDPLCIDLLETWLTRLKNQFELGAMPMTALCLNSQEFNAFAAPGGIVGVNRGVYSGPRRLSQKSWPFLPMSSRTWPSAIIIAD